MEILTLEDLVRHPEQAAALSTEERARLFSQAVTLTLLLGAPTIRANGGAPPAGTGASPGDRAVRLEEAAEILGMTRDALYRKWKALGGYKDVDGHVKFSLQGLQRYIARRAGKPA